MAADLDLYRNCKVHQWTSHQGKTKKREKKKKKQLTSLLILSKCKVKHTWNGMLHSPPLKVLHFRRVEITTVSQYFVWHYQQPELTKCIADNAVYFPIILEHILYNLFHGKNETRTLILTLQLLDPSSSLVITVIKSFYSWCPCGSVFWFRFTGLLFYSIYLPYITHSFLNASK